MITAVHIEDELRNVELLESLINRYFSETIQLKGSAGNITNAYEVIKNQRPQLVFLDIELNNGNAFELLDKIKESFGINFEVIFITAYNEYAIKALKLNALDYILKPISIEELEDAVSKAINKINGSQKDGPDNLTRILKQLYNDISQKKIGIVISEGIEFIKSDDIIKIEAKGSYSIVHLINEKKMTCTKGLRDMEEMLPEPVFLRVHNTWIINAQHLKKYIKGRNGYLQMDDGTHVPVSIRKKGSVLDRF